jgi:hypothetical protein
MHTNLLKRLHHPLLARKRPTGQVWVQVREPPAALERGYGRASHWPYQDSLRIPRSASRPPQELYPGGAIGDLHLAHDRGDVHPHSACRKHEFFGDLRGWPQLRE